MDEKYDDRWRSDIVEAYLNLTNEPSTKSVPLQRRDSTQPPPQQTLRPPSVPQNMLTAPPLEKSDSQWSPMSSGLVTPQDSIGYWSFSPDRRRSGRFSADGSGMYGQSNRWSLGTLSNVSFTELPASQAICEEEKVSDEKISDWNTVETSEALFDEDDSIFHPDDEIIVDQKDSTEAPIKRASIGTRPLDWPPQLDPLSKPLPPIEPRFSQLSLPAKQDRLSLKISTCDAIETEPYSQRTSSYSLCSEPQFKYPNYDPAQFPKVTNRRSFVESPPDMFGTDAWPLTASTSSHSSLWPHEKSLPPTPRSRGTSLSAARKGAEEHPSRLSYDYTIRPIDRPASWNPRCDIPYDFDLNLDRAILGTSLARDHRVAKREEETKIDEQQQIALESLFNTLKISEPPPSNRNSTGSAVRSYVSPTHEMSDIVRQRNVMSRIVSERGLNPAQFDTNPKHARYFVIKSYNEDDVHKSLKFNIWASTEIGNRRLDKAYRESNRAGPIYLFFSVNASANVDGSGQFCGMARMMSPVDYTTSSSVWTQTDKWKGRMDVRWIFVKDIPNSQLRHIRVWNNENKPVTNSRDTQELPPDAGLAMLRIFAEYPAKSSVILTNLVNAEMKETEKEERKSLQSLQSIDEGRAEVEGYSRPFEGYARGSWHSNGDMSGRHSWQIDSSVPVTALNRRNTISTAQRITASTTPTSGIRTHESTYPPPPARYHDSASTNNYRATLSGFAGFGDIYGSNRYPPFHDRNGGSIRYDDYF